MGNSPPKERPPQLATQANAVMPSNGDTIIAPTFIAQNNNNNPTSFSNSSSLPHVTSPVDTPPLPPPQSSTRTTTSTSGGQNDKNNGGATLSTSPPEVGRIVVVHKPSKQTTEDPELRLLKEYPPVCPLIKTSTNNKFWKSPQQKQDLEEVDPKNPVAIFRGTQSFYQTSGQVIYHAQKILCDKVRRVENSCTKAAYILTVHSTDMRNFEKNLKNVIILEGSIARSKHQLNIIMEILQNLNIEALAQTDP